MMKTTPIDNLPDLPELESVQSRDFSIWAIIVAYSAAILLPFPALIWAFITLREFIPPPAVAVLAICAGLIVWVAGRVLLSFLSYKTDASGLTLRGPIRCAYIPWIDVKEAKLEKTLTGTPLFIFRTANGTYKIAPDSMGGMYSSYCMIASTWQHLRRLGRADSIELPDKSLSLWREIGDDIPHEMEWGKRPGFATKLGNIIGLSFFPAITIWFWADSGMRWPLITMPIMLTLMVGALLKLIAPLILKRVYQIRINEECLEAQLLFARVTIFWSQVTSAFWMNTELVIRTGNPRQEVRIRNELGEKEIEQLILAVIRRLRTAGVPQAVPIPELLSTDPDVIKKPAYTNRKRGQLKRAFINALEEPTKSHIKKLYNLTSAAVFIGIFFGAGISFLDISARLSWLIFGHALDTRFFIPFSTLPLGVPLIMANIVVFRIISEYLAQRLAGPYKSIWMEFNEIGQGKANTIVGWICIAIAVAGVVAIPGFATHYVRVTGSGVATRGFFAAREVFHPWSGVRGVQYKVVSHSHNGRPCSSTNYIVEFTDGSSWKYSPGEIWSCSITDAEGAINFISKKSGKPLEYLKSEPD